jgi:Domain of unknown function (DUF5615)
VRFLIDNALSPEVARRLGENGHDALHVRDIGMERAILFRRGAQRRPREQVALLIGNLASIERDLTTGCIAVFEPDRIRIRALPVS